MKKILFIKHPFTERYLSLLTGACVSIVVQSDLEKSIQTPEVETVRTRYRYRRVQRWLARLGLQIHLPMVVPQIITILKQYQPDVLVTADLYHVVTRRCLQYAVKKKITCFIFSETKHWPRFFLSRWYLRRTLAWLKRHPKAVNGILVYSEEGRTFLSAQLPGIPILVMPMPIDTTMFSQTAVVRSEGAPLRILVNARYVRYKRHEDILRAVTVVQKKGIQCQVTCIGRAGDLQTKVQSLIYELGLESVVRCIDPVPLERMSDVYKTHDVLVLASQDEAVGTVVPEAMACGLPTITSDTVGANVYVMPQKTGLVFSTGSVEDLGEAITSLSDESNRYRMAQAAHEHIHTKFSDGALRDQFINTVLKPTDTFSKKDAL